MASNINRLTEEQKSNIRYMYLEEGMQPVAISKMLGLTHYQQVYNYLHESGNYIKFRNGTNIQRKYTLDEHFFDVIDTEPKAYIWGFLAADGYVDETNGRLSWALNVQDINVLEKILKEVDSSQDIKHFIKDLKYSHCKISLNSKYLISKVIEKGMRGGKSLTMPGSIIDCVPENLRRHFIRGYFDGDGCVLYGRVYSSGTKYSITVIGTLDFLTSVFQRYCISNIPIKKYKSCNMYYWVTSRKEHVDNFLSYIYKDANIYLDRKYAIYSAHVKPRELLEAQTEKAVGNQQPSPFGEGSETIEKQLS